MEILRADCLVVGAGPAGATVARLLALKGRDVVVADPGVAATRRLELLAPASLPTIVALGLDHLLDDPSVARRCLGIRRILRSGQQNYEDFMCHPHGIGRVVDRALFDARLRDAAVAAGASFVRARAVGPTSKGGVICRMGDGNRMMQILADVVVDATGRAAAIARRCGAQVSARDRMVADLIENAVDEMSADASWLDYRRDDSSWCYRIHGPGGRVETWRVRTHGSARGYAMRSVDASSCVLSQAAGAGWIAVGDAATSFDPIASQGLFNALSSALVATGALLSADGLNPVTAALYSDAVTATFLYSQTGRTAVYKSSEALLNYGNKDLCSTLPKGLSFNFQQ